MQFFRKSDESRLPLQWRYPKLNGDGLLCHNSDSAMGTYIGFWQSLTRCNFLIFVLILALMLPGYTSFSVGSLRFTVYRVVLVFTILPNLARLISGRYKIVPADIFLAFGLVWAAVTLLYHHGAHEGLESSGILLIESLGPYLLARTMIRTRQEYLSFVSLMLFVCVALFPATIFESVTNKSLFGQATTAIDMRMGLHRARGPFDHPILYGVFVASTLGISWFAFPMHESPVGMPRLWRSACVFLATFSSVSGGPLTALAVQIGLIMWNYLAATIRNKWRLLLYLFLLSYIVIDALSNRTPMRVFLTYLTFSSQTAFDRLLIWDWGFYHNVLVHPVTGIGLNDWTRPDWMHNSSMDNFWLVLMVRHGLPCFLPIAIGGFYLMFVGAKRARATGFAVMQKGWVISMVGLIVAGSTVHFYNQLFVYFFFILGAGAWFCDPKARSEAE